MKISVLFLLMFGCAPVMAFDVAWWMKGNATFVECSGERSGQPVLVVVRGEEVEVSDGQLQIKVPARRQQLARSVHWEAKDIELFINLRLSPRMRELSGQLHVRSSKEWVGLLCLPK